MEPMPLVLQFATWSFSGFFVLLFVLQLAAREVGYAMGRRRATRSEALPESVNVVVGSMLGLLAFVLALTLNFASNRYAERQAATLAEANAVGTAWLRAQAIGHPRGEAVARHFEEYGAVRTAYVQAHAGSPAIDEATARTGELQTLIWGHVSAIVRERPDPVAAALMSAANDAFDMSTATRFAFEKRMPPTLFWLLMCMAVTGMAALGYQLGLRGTPIRLMATLLTAMWTLVMADILDLSAARLGNIRIETGVYDWTLAGFKGGNPIPPPPR